MVERLTISSRLQFLWDRSDDLVKIDKIFFGELDIIDVIPGVFVLIYHHGHQTRVSP